MKEVMRQPEGGLLQSQGWSDMLRDEGKSIVKILCSYGTVFGVVHTLPIVGSYLYIPRLSYILTEKDIDLIVKKARKKECGWVRFDLLREKQVKTLRNAKKAPHNMQPEENLIIDISHSTEDLIAAMKGKTRYNIRLAEKKGVQIEKIHFGDVSFWENFEAFIDMVESTAKRKSVTFHDRRHYEKMFESFPEEYIALYVARYEDEIIATNIVTFYGGVATYLHGGTSDKHRNVMAPFLLQWRAIQDAKEGGCTYYDFGGVYSETKDAGKQGITRFKKSFAPQEKFLVNEGSHDLVLSAITYRSYRFLQKLR